ncbi:MAG: hypothetical protein H6606_03170 [Flavobacteriales bacterium]|nr:hypothetical protein [Flavobacteriales bacterium]
MTRISRFIFSFSLLTWLTATVCAQPLPLQISDSLARLELHIGHTSITQTNSLSYNFLRSSKWNNEDKSDQLDRTGNKLRLGYGNQTELAYRFKHTLSGTQGIRIVHSTINGLSISKSLFELALLGNTPFKGAKLNVDRSALLNAELSSVLYELSKEGDRYFDKIGIAFGAHIGQNYRELSSEEGYFYTDSMAEFIETNIAYRALSDRNTLISGLGPAVGLYLEHKGAGSKWKLEVPDLGLLVWSSAKTVQNAQETQRFDGFYVPDITDLSGNWIDTLEQDYLEINNEHVWTLSPYRIHFSYARVLTKDLNLDLSLFYRNIPGFTPQLSAKVGGVTNSSVYSCGITYGGFGTFRSDLNLLLPLSPGVRLLLRGEGLESLVATNMPMGMVASAALYFAMP